MSRRSKRSVDKTRENLWLYTPTLQTGLTDLQRSLHIHFKPTYIVSKHDY